MTEGPTEPVDARADDDLDLLTADDGRRRTNPRTLAAIAVVVALLLAVVASTTGSGDPEEVAARSDAPEAQRTEAPGRSTSTTSATTLLTELTTTTLPDQAQAPTSTTSGPVTTVPRRASTTPTSTSPAPPAAETPETPETPETTVAVPACRNSTDPACGPFYWDPAPPPNQPLTASFVDLPSTWDLADGHSFEIFFAWNDPDGALMYFPFSIDGSPVSRSWQCHPAYGPWTPSPPYPTAGVRSAGYVYLESRPATYELNLAVGTMGCGFWQTSDVLLTATIEVVDSRTDGSSGADGEGDAVGVG